MKVMFPRLTHEYGRGWILSLEVDPDSVQDAKNMVDAYKSGYIEITCEPWKERRSLQANSYFHVLVNKIAGKLGISSDECKREMVDRYGTFARLEGSTKYVAAKVPPGTDMTAFYPYVRNIGPDKDGLERYLFFKRTSELNTAEMSRLIEGTISEAKELKIETLPPHELQAMMARWKEENNEQTNPDR